MIPILFLGASEKALRYSSLASKLSRPVGYPLFCRPGLNSIYKSLIEFVFLEATEPVESGSNIILMGATGAGKTSTGRLLARLVGYGFLDLDELIEQREHKTVQELFEARGEDHFRELERAQLRSLSGLRSHVLSVGGGTVMDDESWTQLQDMGATVWINTPAEEIARRLLARESELSKRPLLAEVLSHKDNETRLRLLSERLKALIGNRVGRYKQARLAVSDSFSTPETTAHLVKDLLVREGILTLSREHCPFDRWGSL